MSWRPDWQDAPSYEFDEDIAERWAWEFMRRSTKYTDDFKAYQEKDLCLTKKYGPRDSKKSETSMFESHWLDHSDGFHFSPPREEHESFVTWRTANSNNNPQWQHWEAYYTRKWWLTEHLADPADSVLPDFRPWIPTPYQMDLEDLQEIYAEQKSEEYDDPADEAGQYGPSIPVPPFAVLTFDVSLDIETQVQTAKALLLARRALLPQDYPPAVVSTSHRKRRDKWPLYLRVLDAEFDGATPTDIANILLKHEDNTAATGHGATKKSSDFLIQAPQMLERSRILHILLTYKPKKSKKQ
jgi:hypothetical protein